jgi:CheY-like chemotaxis protein
VSLPPLIRESVKLYRSSLPSTVEIAMDLEPDVPAVMLDPVHLDQILLNLCLNARDAMGGVGTIGVSVVRVQAKEWVCTACRQPATGGFVELCVADDGAGIAPDVLDRIFDPFFTTKEVGKGSGMGLASVHGIVHELGGHVVVETAPCRGTRFRVLFPALAEGNEHVGVDHTTRVRAPLARLRGHILIVDDEHAVGAYMRDLLESWGLDATVTNAPSDAVSLFARDAQRFQLVITDQAMPRMTGTQLARELIALRPNLPVILYTGFNEGIVRSELDGAGLRAVVTKPIDPHHLYGLLQTHLPHAPI